MQLVSQDKRRILLISPSIIAKDMAGPSIRYLNIASHLAKDFDVELLIPPGSDIDVARAYVETYILSKVSLKESLKRSDVVILQGLTLAQYPAIKRANIPTVIDLYDPFILENLELRKGDKFEHQLYEYDRQIILEQLVYGDYFLCSNERQWDFWAGMLLSVGRLNPYTYRSSPDLDTLIGLLPFGLPSVPPRHEQSVLKGVHPAVPNTSKVLLWGGGIWDWLDPITPIEAMVSLAESDPSVRLFFMGTGKPGDKMNTMAKAAIHRADQLGLSGRTVIFNDWVAYDSRQNFLNESDLGVSSHFNNIETRLSFRTRILDYIWAAKPIVTSEGDYMADLVVRRDLGRVVPVQNPGEMSKAVLELLRDRRTYERQVSNLISLRNEMTWERQISDLRLFCENATIQQDKIHKRRIVLERSMGKVLFFLTRHPVMRSTLRNLRSSLGGKRS